MVGDPAIQRIDVLAGSLLDRLAEAEGRTEKGQIVLDASALTALGDHAEVVERDDERDGGRPIGVLRRLTIDVPDAPVRKIPALDRAIVREWLLPTVYERITTGRGEFLSELRSAYPVFVRFSGIDFDADDAAIDKLNAFVIQIQKVLDSYGGNLLQLTLGDKGAYLYGVFGSPHAHEDDAARAAAAALDLLRLEDDTVAHDLQIGIAHGQLLSGTYGHRMRRTFVCLGDATNLAARLMSAAPPGTIYVADEVRVAAGDSFDWERVEPLRLKGKADAVAASALTGSIANAARRRQRYELPIVGRSAELEYLQSALELADDGNGHIVALSGEAGLGKSRLIAEFVRDARRRGIFVALGECQSFGSNTSYFAWQEIWRRLLDIDEEAPVDTQRAAAVAALRRVDPGLAARTPLLADVLGVSIPDTELTRTFDPKLRKSSLEDLLATCLRDRAAREPVILVVEDCHWIDSLSCDLLEALARASATSRVLIVLAYRPAAATGGDLGLETLPQFAEIALAELSPEESRQVISGKTAQLFELESPPDELVDLVVSRAQGNPFYAEELLNFIASRGVHPEDSRAIRELDLPDSLHSLVLSRIDALAENPRRTLKVASVIGRVFRGPALPDIYPDLGSIDEVLDRLEELQGEDLVTLDQAESLSYLFRHVVTQEVSYNSMPYSIRSDLHRRVGEQIERAEVDDLEQHLDLLAHHFWHGDDEDKKRLYLSRAAESAASRYAIPSAVDYGERLAALLDGADRAEALLRLGKALELAGEWPRAEEVAADAYTIANDLGYGGLAARCETALAEAARRQVRYEEAEERLASAAETFRSLGDDEGLGVSLHLSGTVAAQRGDLEAARSAYEASLEIRERLSDRVGLASMHNNLAIVSEYSGDYPSARAANERALAIRRELGDRWAISASLNNIGMIDCLQGQFAEARVRFEESLQLCREVGDPWMVALTRNNLGNAHRGLGDQEAARHHYAESLEGYRTLDDQWGLAFLLEDIAVLAVKEGDDELAFELIGACETLRDAIGSPHSKVQQEELNRQTAPAEARLGDQEAVARARGRELSLTSAVDMALRLTRPVYAT